ncbi:MAG: sulfatase-like hydrolase/transferase [Acidobacteria bacterium]|nr:sulfatase-like hydrolase/transferase [Acidobacteriota bacterium]
MRWRVACLAAAIVVAAFSTWLLPGARGPWSRRRHHPNLLLISIDTLRPDHLGCYGYGAARTPTIDALAARGVRFADAVTVTPLTLPAHASLLTGTFPAYHGVRDNGGFYLPPELVTLAEILRGVGYRTAGFVGAFVLDSRWGLQQGFDLYADGFDLSQANGAAMDTIQHPANEVVDQALRWLDQKSDKPFFGWVHLYDPHAPYTAPQQVAAQFPPTLEGAYDAEIAWTDTQVGRLIDRLAQLRTLDETIVIIVGDHGESLGEHGEAQHGFFVYDAALRVPLIVAGLGLSTTVVRDQVRIVDVMPTTLDLMGVPVPAAVQGQSLRPALNGQHLELLAFGETWYPRYHYGWCELLAVRDGRYKFVLAPERELYDLQTDPRETRNLSSARPARADALERALLETLARIRRADAGTARQRIDRESEERLRALGYLSGQVGSRKPANRSCGDPKDKVELYNLLRLASDDSADGRIDEAIAKVTQVLAADDEVVEAHTMLGSLHLKAKRYGDAVDAYRRALALDPEYQRAAFDLAIAYKAMGRLDDARAGFERARQLDPRSGTAELELADIAMQKREFEVAAALLTKGLEQSANVPAYLVKLGECQIELKRYDEAEKRLREALEANPKIERAHYDLGVLYEARGSTDKAAAEYEAETALHGSYSASFNLAKLLSRAGRHTEAVARFREAVDANPEFGTGYLYLAKALLDAGNLAEAERAARTGLSAHPDPPMAPLGHYVLADVYSRLGRVRDADRELRAARALEKR